MALMLVAAAFSQMKSNLQEERQCLVCLLSQINDLSIASLTLTS